jgi:hypothetical protein
LPALASAEAGFRVPFNFIRQRGPARQYLLNLLQKFLVKKQQLKATPVYL